MDEQAGLVLMLKARSGDPEAQRQLLSPHLRALRLCAAAYLPTLADVDRVVRAVAGEAARTFADAADGEAFASWLRGLARTKIAEQLARLAGDGERLGDPLARVLITSGRERLTTRVSDIDPEEALRRRLQLTPKGARDLLAQRFGQGQSLDRLAEHRGLGVDDLATALQTACRQLDWSADVFCGAALDSTHYRALDGLLGGADSDPAELRQHLLGDPELTLKVERAARAHLIATAWHAPELVLEARDLATGTRRITNNRQFPSPGAGTPPEKNASSPTRRAVPSRRHLPATATGPERQADRPERGSRTVTLVSLLGGGGLVLAGVIALILRSQSTTPMRPPPTATPITAPEPPAAAATTAPAVAPVIPPATDGDHHALFSGPGALPVPLVAYSVRRLVGSYSGPLLRVRRSSDNTERDIAATSTGGLDTASLTLFVGKANGHVVSWYDQSGAGHHLAQPAPDTQPLIARNGALENESGRPVLSFDRTKFQHLSTPSALQAGTLFVLVRAAGPNNGAQGIIGSKADGSVDFDGYYPIVDRDRNSKGEWWVGQLDKLDKLEFPMPAKRLVLWASATDGAERPTLTMQLDGVAVASKRLETPGVRAIGPTVVGCVYWRHDLVDPFSGSLGEIIMLPPALAPEAVAAITANLKAWWRLP